MGRDALRRQQQLNEKLQYELDEERDASAESTQEALAMIYRLQKEKHEKEREASLFKEIQACAEQEKLSLENLLDEKDYVIETLRSEIQSLKQSVGVQYHNNSNVNHEIRSSNPADDFSEFKEVVNDHGLLIPLVESTSQKRGAEQLEIFTGNNISPADKQSTNSENANENSRMNVNMNKKRCILITEKESNTSEVSDQAADALAQPEFMEEDDENNDTCIVGSGFDFSVSDRLAHDKDVQQIFGRMQTLVEERKSMAQTIQHLKIQNGALMELITKFAHQHPINEEETQKAGHKLSKKTTKGKTRSTVNTMARLPEPGWVYFFLMGWTILIVALLKPGYL